MRFRSFVPVLTLIAVGACGGADGGTTPPAATVSRVTVSGPLTPIYSGQTAQLAAAAFTASGAGVVNPGSVAWSSSAMSVATVDQTGLITAVRVGTTTISAKIGSVTGTLGLTVSPVPSVKDTIFTPGLNFSPNTLTVRPGTTVVFALGFDGTGHDVQFAAQAGAPAYIPVSVRKFIPVTFPIAGTFPFTCPTHPEMTGVITVQ